MLHRRRPDLVNVFTAGPLYKLLLVLPSLNKTWILNLGHGFYMMDEVNVFLALTI